MIILFIFLNLVVTVLNFLLLRDFRYPPFLYSLVWMVVILMYYISFSYKMIDIYQLSHLSLILFFLNVVSFSLGGITAIFMFKGKKVPEQVNVFQLNKVGVMILNLILIVSLMIFPFYVKKAIEIAAQGKLGNFFLDLRWQLNYSNADYGILKYGASLAMIGALLYTLVDQEMTFRKFLIIVLAFLYALLYTGRTNILLLLILVSGRRFLSKELNIKYILFSFIIFFSIFYSFSVTLGKGGNIGLSLKQNITLVAQTFLKYLIGSLVAFDKFINTRYDLLLGKQTFRFFTVIFYKVGLIYDHPISLVKNFIYVPFATNVYTICEYYVHDFGILGCINVLYFFGFLHTYFYFKMNKSFLCQAFYVIMLYPLILSFFEDQYFSLLSIWLQFLIIIYFIDKIGLRRKFEGGIREFINNYR